jgi:hypothetical protein
MLEPENTLIFSTDFMHKREYQNRVYVEDLRQDRIFILKEWCDMKAFKKFRQININNITDEDIKYIVIEIEIDTYVNLSALNIPLWIEQVFIYYYDDKYTINVDDLKVPLNCEVYIIENEFDIVEKLNTSKAYNLHYLKAEDI